MIRTYGQGALTGAKSSTIPVQVQHQADEAEAMATAMARISKWRQSGGGRGATACAPAVRRATIPAMDRSPARVCWWRPPL